MFKALVLSFLAIFLVLADASAQIQKGYDVLRYEGTIELDRQDTFIRGHVKMHAVVTTAVPIYRILQHLSYLEIDSVLVNGERATIDWTGRDSGEYYVVPPAATMIPGEFVVETYYHGKPLPEQTANKWGGVSNRGNMFFAMGVGFQAPYISCTRHWLPSYDLPDDKPDSARFIFVSKTAGDVVAAAGELERVFDTLGGRAYDWNIRYPIATYLMTFAQGPFELMKIANPLNIPFESYAQPVDTAKTRKLMERSVVKALSFFDSLFVPYPFEKVGYVVAPIGSMEHQTMITLDRRTLDTNNTTAVHELAHMWWGDLVTCHTFADPWLNEGFATFSESLYLERFNGEQAYRKRQWSKIKSAKTAGSDYPMYGAPYHTGHTSNYPGAVIYDKGAAVLGMLRYHLGDALFFAGVKTYLERFAYKTATSYDLWQHFESVTGQDLDWFFQKWVFEKGYPKFDVSYSTGKVNRIRIRQSSTSGYFKLPIMVEGTMTTGEKRRQVLWTDSAEVSTFDLEFDGFETSALFFDPDSVLIADFQFSPLNVAEEATLPTVRVSPNPAGVQFNVSGLPKEKAAYFVHLVDSGGKSHMAGMLSRDGEDVRVPLGDVANGSYRLVIYRLKDGVTELAHTQQVIVQH